MCCCCLGELNSSMKRLSGSAGCCAPHSLREQNGHFCCVYILTQRLQEGQALRGSHSARADVPPGQHILLRGDMGHSVVLWVRPPCMKGSVGRGEYPYKSLVFLDSTSLFQQPHCSCGSSPGPDGKRDATPSREKGNSSKNTSANSDSLPTQSCSQQLSTSSL